MPGTTGGGMGIGGQIWSQAAANTATGVFGMAAQRIGANYDRRQQLKTQEALNKMSMAQNKEMARYNKELDLQMWNDTGYGAQMAQMKAANINPGLLYGMSGGGAQTVGNSAGASGAAPSAGLGHVGGVEGLQMGLGIADTKLKMAQAANLEADTNKKIAELPNVGKTGQNIDASTASLLQGVENMVAQKALTEADTRIRNTQAITAEETQLQSIERIMADADRAISEAKSAMAQANVDEATQQSKISILEGTAAGTWLENKLTASKTSLTTQQITNLKQEILQNWEKLSIEDMKNVITKGLGELNAGISDKNADTGIVKAIMDGLESIWNMFKKKPTGRR